MAAGQEESRLLDQLKSESQQSKLGNLGLLFGGDPNLLFRLVAEPRLKHAQHFLRAASGGADDEDVAEPRLVGGVRFGQGVEYVFRGPLGA